MAVTIPAMDLRRRAGELLSRVRYAGERFVIERNGEPVAAIVGIEDLRRLQAIEESSDARRSARRQMLAAAQSLRETILARRGGIPMPDSADELRQLREERDGERDSLR